MAISDMIHPLVPSLLLVCLPPPPFDMPVELATVSMVDGKLQYKILDNATVDTALKELDLAQPAAESS